MKEEEEENEEKTQTDFKEQIQRRRRWLLLFTTGNRLVCRHLSTSTIYRISMMYSLSRTNNCITYDIVKKLLIFCLVKKKTKQKLYTINCASAGNPIVLYKHIVREENWVVMRLRAISVSWAHCARILLTLFTLKWLLLCAKERQRTCIYTTK